MHPKVFIYESAQVNDRIRKATAQVAATFGVEAPVVEFSRDEMTYRLNEQRALADFLERLAGVQLTTVGAVTSIEGLSKTSVKTINMHFGVIDDGATD